MAIPVKSVKGRLSNSELFIFALYLRGDAGEYIDIEEVFVEMFRIAPERFRWRLFDYPQYEICHKALGDVERRKSKYYDLVMKSRDGLARQLTAKGIAWVEERQGELSRLRCDKPSDPPAKRPSQKAMSQLERDPIVQAFITGNPPNLARHEAALLLKCAPDSPQAVWRERLESNRALATKAQRDDLLRFLNWLVATYPDWFGAQR